MLNASAHMESVVFFFSSRRRHTRFDCDWSSDVCSSDLNTVDTGYVPTMGIPVLQGRTFTESDSDRSQKVVVIDQFLARKYWPRGDAIGAQIRRGIDNDEPVCTIIGVVGSVKTSNLADHNPVGQVY